LIITAKHLENEDMNILDKHYTTDLLEDIQTVKHDLLNKFPNVSYTLRILIWDDDTISVECSHTDENNRRYASKIYNGILSYEEYELTGKVMVLNDFGEEEYYKLVKTK